MSETLKSSREKIVANSLTETYWKTNYLSLCRLEPLQHRVVRQERYLRHLRSYLWQQRSASSRRTTIYLSTKLLVVCAVTAKQLDIPTARREKHGDSAAVQIGKEGDMNKNLYDQDFYAWTQTTAQMLKDRKFDAVDWDNLIEEVETLGRSEKRAIKSHLVILLLHLLKWQFQPEHRSRSWTASIGNTRSELIELLVPVLE